MSSHLVVLSVCKKCFLAVPSEAIEDCPEHPFAERCDVYWDSGSGVYREYTTIRPLPDKAISGRFIRCTFDYRCRGDRCTFAHSDAERAHWNRQLEQQGECAYSECYKLVLCIGQPLALESIIPLTLSCLATLFLLRAQGAQRQLYWQCCHRWCICC